MIGIIGVGNMGMSLYKGLIKKYNPQDIYLCDSDIIKLQHIDAAHIFSDPQKIIQHCDLIFIAVKPQSFASVCNESDFSNATIISIMAGVLVQTIYDLTKARQVIRTMPNLPIQVQQGVFGYVSDDRIDPKVLQQVEQTLSIFGEVVALKSEDMLDKLTVLSGSGPAYFFYLTELLQKKALQFGFSQEESKKICEMTFGGSAKLFDQSDTSAEEFRKKVTSKGGTTEAVIDSMQADDFESIFSKALDVGVKRAKEL